MVLWQVGSYRVGIEAEQCRLRAVYQLRSWYGAGWDRQVPDDLAWMLRGGVLLRDAFVPVAELTGLYRSPEPAMRGTAWTRSAPATPALAAACCRPATED
jgi:hypothetical protein